MGRVVREPVGSIRTRTTFDPLFRSGNNVILKLGLPRFFSNWLHLRPPGDSAGGQRPAGRPDGHYQQGERRSRTRGPGTDLECPNQ
jgi:hypothetical protein